LMPAVPKATPTATTAAAPSVRFKILEVTFMIWIVLPVQLLNIPGRYAKSHTAIRSRHLLSGCKASENLLRSRKREGVVANFINLV
jgi:hypothetical protein